MVTGLSYNNNIIASISTTLRVGADVVNFVKTVNEKCYTYNIRDILTFNNSRDH